jgi:regulatory protein
VNKQNVDALKKAKYYAFLLLKFRPRSEKEIFTRLKKKKFNAQTIKETLSFLKDKDFINDALFAKSWIDSRLKKPLGLKRIRQELRIKGIDQKILDRQLEEVKKNYAEADIIAKLAQQRLKRLKGVEPQKAKRRIFAYLLRRGFSADAVMDTINQL